LSAFTRGKYAFGFCDEIVNQRPTGFLVGRDVVDPDQPQLQLGKILVDDPRSLRNPRPDRAEDASRALFSFDPVGQIGLGMTGGIGFVGVILES
jgi:hypothetical protein